jgi:hypothetical protein
LSPQLKRRRNAHRRISKGHPYAGFLYPARQLNIARTLWRCAYLLRGKIVLDV